MKQKKISLCMLAVLLSLVSCSENNSSLLSSSSSSEMISTAKEETKVKVMLNGNGGYLEENEIVLIYQKEYALPVPETTADMGNVVFQGWYYQNRKIETVGDRFPLKEDCTLIARYQSLDFEFTSNGNSYTLSKNLSKENEIVIPSYYNGLPVTKIAKNVFAYNRRITSLILPSTLEEIGSQCFYHMDNLKNVEFSKGIKKISYSAFEECPKLKAVYFNGTVEDYLSIQFEEMGNPCCNKASLYFQNQLLVTITIPDTFTSINNYAFNGVTSIKKVALPETITSIGEKAFEGNSSLSEINFPSSLTQIGDFAFKGCTSLVSVDIKGSLYSIPVSCFENCYLLESVLLPTDIKEIESNAFKSCYKLSSISLPEHLTTIGSSAFERCTSLPDIPFPESLVTISSSAFSYCSKLSNLSFKKNLTSIQDGAFSGCSNVQSITMENENTIYEAKNNTLVEKNTKRVVLGCQNSILEEGIVAIGSQAFFSCFSLKEIEFPDSLVTIENYAFSNCTGLKKISFGKNLLSIGRNSFTGASGIEEILVDEQNSVYSANGNCLLSKDGQSLFYGCKKSVIPSSVKTIEEDAFYFCSNLKSIDIPGNVTSIKERAFGNCYDLESVTLSEGLNSLGEYVFYSCSDLKSISLPDTLREIPSHCFERCYFLERVTLPNHLESILDSAFSMNTSLLSLSLPKTLRSMGEACFFLCESLNALSVDEENESFSISDNCLMDKKGEKLYFGYGDFTIPSSTKEISSYAFFHNQIKSDITFPQNVIVIGEYACAEMTRLRSITLPSSIDEIKDGAFSACEDLSIINYEGTKSAFEKIILGYEVFFDTAAYEICAKDGDIELSEKYVA